MDDTPRPDVSLSGTTERRTANDQTEVLAYDGDGNPITRGQYQEWENSDCRNCGASDLDGFVVTDDEVLCYGCFEDSEGSR